jgi:3-deoxy-D-arabino-heptulosonate 7-phosphate (DAHP) synthase
MHAHKGKFNNEKRRYTKRCGAKRNPYREKIRNILNTNISVPYTDLGMRGVSDDTEKTGTFATDKGLSEHR